LRVIHFEDEAVSYISREDEPLNLRWCAEKGCANQTTDYRCKECQEKWKRKHNVPLDAADEGEYVCGISST
jgi:predicted SprT family Zn-dependent metalloprotease